MGTLHESNTAIAIVADPCNYAAEEFFEKQLALSTSKCPECQRYQIISDALTHSIHSSGSDEEIRSKFDKGHKVVVAIIGVPDASNYAADMHGLLDAWEKAPNKPALLLVSSQPDATRKAVENWAGWKKLPDQLKAVIKVNDEYLVINGTHALSSLKSQVAAYEQLQQSLKKSYDNSLTPVVVNPALSQSANLIVSGLTKG